MALYLLKKKVFVCLGFIYLHGKDDGLIINKFFAGPFAPTSWIIRESDGINVGYKCVRMIIYMSYVFV